MKKFKMIDAILLVICVVFVAEAAAPVASLGNSQFFWWAFMIICFLLPYGLISAELGTTFQGDGGLYDWVNRAYPGSKWGGRAAWWYYINFPLWMASLAVMCPNLIGLAFGIEIPTIASLAIQLAFIWICTVIARYPVCDSVIILNVCSALKVLLAVLAGGMGIYFVATHGFVNPMTPASFLPSFDVNSLSYISVIIFNCLGFEVICTLSDDMEDPKKQIPQAIIVGGIAIAAIYLFGAFGIGAAIPVDQINTDSGLVDAFIAMTGQEGGILIAAVALLFMVTLFGNMISWSMGVNNTAAYAAEHGDMPAVFARRDTKNDMPVGSAMVTGYIASVIVVLGVVMKLVAPESGLFWTFFQLNLVMFIMSYLPVFPAFLKLRRTEPDTPRPFCVPGGPALLRVLAFMPMLLIAVSIFFCAVPLGFDAETLSGTLPVTIGAIIAVVIGEVLVGSARKKAKHN